MVGESSFDRAEGEVGSETLSLKKFVNRQDYALVVCFAKRFLDFQ